MLSPSSNTTIQDEICSIYQNKVGSVCAYVRVQFFFREKISIQSVFPNVYVGIYESITFFILCPCDFTISQLLKYTHSFLLWGYFFLHHHNFLGTSCVEKTGKMSLEAFLYNWKVISHISHLHRIVTETHNTHISVCTLFCEKAKYF